MTGLLLMMIIDLILSDVRILNDDIVLSLTGIEKLDLNLMNKAWTYEGDEMGDWICVSRGGDLGEDCGGRYRSKC